MTTTAAPPLEQHNVEIQRNRAAWGRKPMLREIYHDFYRLIAARIDLRFPRTFAARLLVVLEKEKA